MERRSSGGPPCARPASPWPTRARPPATGADPAAPAAGRPAPDTCLALPEAADGRYTVADAGIVVVTRDGDRLVLGEITPAEGCTAEEVDTEADEVEVELRNDADELDLEVEVEDGGRLSVVVRADDD